MNDENNVLENSESDSVTSESEAVTSESPSVIDEPSQPEIPEEIASDSTENKS